MNSHWQTQSFNTIAEAAALQAIAIDSIDHKLSVDCYEIGR